MGLRITTWNVNGIRNPFGYQPWRDKRTFAAMFEILESDIVVMQETKIQKKDLRDDMVLVPGWDVYFSLPKHKKGYSGVAIYTRNAMCAPIRAEEGITGVLCPPNSSTSFSNMPEDQQIGGYPTISQLEDCNLDAATLDSEGRCVVLEFPAFVLIGVYCPANRDESRDDFRIGFLTALDARVRNLIALGKRVFLTGDLNIIREELDTANAKEQLQKHGMTMEDYISTPARRILNHLLVDGKIVGSRDEGRDTPVMWDICRAFHPDRNGMFTCWDQKINARPGNFGSRIDYVLCSTNWKGWFCESNIQEGLMGSDHCPVYAVIKDKVDIEGSDVDIRDVMNPSGTFKDGQRLREWSNKDLLPMSAKLIPEFDRRRSIRDMFTKKPSLPSGESSRSIFPTEESITENENDPIQTPIAASPEQKKGSLSSINVNANSSEGSNSIPSAALPSSIQATTITKRTTELFAPARPPKRTKSSSASKVNISNGKGQPTKGQKSLMGFFKPKTSKPGEKDTVPPLRVNKLESSNALSQSSHDTLSKISMDSGSASSLKTSEEEETAEKTQPSDILKCTDSPFRPEDQPDIVDPIVAKESWSKLLSKRVAPRCEHNEPCVSYVTKKAGVNCGRSFYMCPRPLGPSGQKEKNSQWRCGTFIWSSDWTGDGTQVT